MESTIKDMDFCIAVSNKGLKSSGINSGDILLVTGTKVAPARRSDPYLQRVYVIVMKFVNGELQVPKDDNDYKAYVVDPRHLNRVKDQDEYNKQLGVQYREH